MGFTAMRLTGKRRRGARLCLENGGMTMIKRIAALAMMLCLFALPALSAENLTVTIDTGATITLKDSDNDGAYEIMTANELYAFAAAVNDGHTSIDGELTADITVNTDVLNADGSLNGTPARVWSPIGNTKGTRYTGQFDGGNHTISGLYFSDAEARYVGFFGAIQEASVTNVTVKDSWFFGAIYVGGIVGCASNVTGDTGGLITGCTSAASVQGTEGIGGIVGGNYSAEIAGCVNKGMVMGVDGKDAFGEEGTPSEIGGIAGRHTNYTSSLTRCANQGEVYAPDGSSVGGVVGTGGSACSITDCYNSAPVTGSSSVGGVVGDANNGRSITDCYNSAQVTGRSSSFVGGVVGAGGLDCSITNCYFNSTVFSGKAVGKTYSSTIVTNVEGKTDAQFASGEVAYLLNGDQSEIVFTQNLGSEKAPGFGGKQVYMGYGSCGDEGYTNAQNPSETKPAHTPAYTAEENMIAHACSVCKTVFGTATLSAEDAVYNGAELKTATVAYSEGWTGGELTPAYENNVNAGTATASIAIGGATASVEFTIAQSATSMTAELLDNKSEYTYGETVKIAVTPAATGAAPLSLRRFTAPAKGQVALYNGSEQITEPKAAGHGEPVTFTLDTVADGLTPGGHTLTARYTASGNMDAQETDITFSVAFAEDAPANDADVSGDRNEAGWHRADPTLTAPEDSKISLGCGPEVTWSDSLTLPTEDGEHPYTYYVKDESGLISEKTVTVMVDKSAPVVGEIDIQVGTNGAEITAPATDEHSGILDCRLTVNSGKGELEISGNGDGSYTITGMIPGETYDFTLTVRDKVGHTTAVSFTVTAAQLPQTGDESQLGLWLMLMGMACAGMLTLRRKAHN